MPISPERRAARRRHLVDAAHALIRETGGAGFSMAQLAARAGVSPATPYNLVGSKSELLRLVVGDEFERFSIRLARLPPARPLARLLSAVDLVVMHYGDDPGFYRGLYHAALGTEATELGRLMLTEGRALWRGMVHAAAEAGELAAFVRVEPLTDVLLRTIGITTETWLAESWDPDRFATEMAHAVRLVVASTAVSAGRDALVQEIAALQAALAVYEAPPQPVAATA